MTTPAGLVIPATKPDTLEIRLNSATDAKVAVMNVINILRFAKNIGAESIVFELERSNAQKIQEVLGRTFNGIKCYYAYREVQHPNHILYVPDFTPQVDIIPATRPPAPKVVPDPNPQKPGLARAAGSRRSAPLPVPPPQRLEPVTTAPAIDPQTGLPAVSSDDL